MRGMRRVVQLEPDDRRISILGEVEGVGGVREEHELGFVARIGIVVQARAASEETGEEVGPMRVVASQVAELMAPSEIDETVHVPLMIVLERTTGRVEWNREPCL